MKTTIHSLTGLLFLFLFIQTAQAQTFHISPTVNNGGFESGTTGWSFAQNDVSTTDANKWVVGSNSTPYSGSGAAYITTGASGNPYSYNYSSTGVFRTSHMYRDVTFPAGETTINLTFYWKGGGEYNWDRLLVSMGPTTVTPVSGVPTSNSTPISGTTLLWTQPTDNQMGYTQASITITSAVAGNATSSSTRRLIFTWQCDDNTGISPAASIDDIILTSKCTPVATITSSPQCSGQPVTFTATTTNSGNAPTYQWKLNGSNVGTNSNKFTATNWNSGTTVKVDVTSNAQCAASATVASNLMTMVEILLVPVNIFIDASPDSIACAGKDITFNSHFNNGGSQPAYQWLVNGVDVPNAIDATFTTKTLSNSDRVSVNFKSSVGCALPKISNEISMHLSPSLTPSVNVETFIIGNDYTFTAIANNAGNNPSYQWQKNGENVPDGNQQVYKTSYLSPEDIISVQIISSDLCASPMTAKSKDVLVRVATGLNETENTDQHFTVYPNPNDGQLTIMGSIDASDNSTTSVRILDILGQVVANEKIQIVNGKLHLKMDLKNKLAAGNYFVQILANNKGYTTTFTVR